MAWVGPSPGADVVVDVASWRVRRAVPQLSFAFRFSKDPTSSQAGTGGPPDGPDRLVVFWVLVGTHLRYSGYWLVPIYGTLGTGSYAGYSGYWLVLVWPLSVLLAEYGLQHRRAAVNGLAHRRGCRRNAPKPKKRAAHQRSYRVYLLYAPAECINQ